MDKITDLNVRHLLAIQWCNDEVYQLAKALCNWLVRYCTERRYRRHNFLGKFP